MKQIFLLSMILVLCCSASCKTPQRPTTAKSAKTTSLSGSFESKRGVIVALSCFCYNGGYLNTASGEEIAICIADDKTEINCKSPTFTGEYVTVTQAKDTNGVCPGGTMTYFKATSVRCD